MLHVYSTQGSSRKVTLQESTEMQVSRLLLYHDPSSYIHSPNSKWQWDIWEHTYIEDIIFDESVTFDKYIDNSPTDEEFAENINDGKHEKVNVRIRYRDKDGNEQVTFQNHNPRSYWCDCIGIILTA